MKNTARLLIACGLSLVWTALPASGQLVSESDEARRPKPKPDCLDGTRYDDGKLESGLRPVAFSDNLVMLFEAPSYPAKLEKICIAWRKTSFWNDIWFDVRIWRADGPNGGPGTLLDTIPALNAPRVLGRNKFFNYDVSGYGIVIDGPVYIGPFWDPLDAFLIHLGMDTGPRTPRQRAFFNVGVLDDHPPATEIGTTIQTVPQYRALGIRVKFGPP